MRKESDLLYRIASLSTRVFNAKWRIIKELAKIRSRFSREALFRPKDERYTPRGIKILVAHGSENGKVSGDEDEEDYEVLICYKKSAQLKKGAITKVCKIGTQVEVGSSKNQRRINNNDEASSSSQNQGYEEPSNDSGGYVRKCTWMTRSVRRETSKWAPGQAQQTAKLPRPNSFSRCTEKNKRRSSSSKIKDQKAKKEIRKQFLKSKIEWKSPDEISAMEKCVGEELKALKYDIQQQVIGEHRMQKIYKQQQQEQCEQDICEEKGRRDQRERGRKKISAGLETSHQRRKTSARSGTKLRQQQRPTLRNP